MELIKPAEIQAEIEKRKQVRIQAWDAYSKLDKGTLRNKVLAAQRTSDVRGLSKWDLIALLVDAECPSIERLERKLAQLKLEAKSGTG
jgi:hypothetical protein